MTQAAVKAVNNILHQAERGHRLTREGAVALGGVEGRDLERLMALAADFVLGRLERRFGVARAGVVQPHPAEGLASRGHA